MLVAFTSVPASLFLLIFPCCSLRKSRSGEWRGEASAHENLSLRVDDLLLVIIGFSSAGQDDHLSRSSPHSRDPDQSAHRLLHADLCARDADHGVIAGRVRPLTGFFFILKYFEYFFVFFMVVNHVSTKRQVVSLVTALLAICFVISVYAIVQIPSGQRASAPFEGKVANPIPSAGTWSLSWRLSWAFSST